MYGRFRLGFRGEEHMVVAVGGVCGGADPPGALQGVLYHNEELPQDILDFLKVRRCQQCPKGSSPP